MFNVWAYSTSPISGSEIAYELIPCGPGFVFQNNETGTMEMGTYTENPNKYEALEKFYKIFRELSPRFELI